MMAMMPARRMRWHLSSVLIVLVLAGALLFWMQQPVATGAVRFVVVHGESARQIATQLRDQKMIWSPWSFLFWVKVIDRHHAIRAGIYHLPSPSTGWTLFQVVHRGPPLIKMTFPEGWTSQQMSILLEAKDVTPAAGFLAAVKAHHAEGFLFPDTYKLPEGMTPDAVVQRLTDRFHELEPVDIHSQATLLKLSYADVVTLASMVEREARLADERPIIAGVFLNRLHKHMRLESCATVEYALGVWKPRLSYQDLNVVSPYNTYRHAGLPPSPICNPGMASLEAAVHPTKTDMLFFVADGEGAHHFSKTYKEHLAVQKQIPTPSVPVPR